MFLSRFNLDRHAARLGDFSALMSVASAHQLVWRWFPAAPGSDRRFLFRVEQGDALRVWTLSETEPSQVDTVWSVESKRFTPELRNGDKLQFIVRVNPTFRANNGDGAGKRHDVVMEGKRNRRVTGETFREADLVQQACVEWLRSREERCGFELNTGTARADGYRIERFARKSGPAASVAVVDLTGSLTVSDAQMFVRSLMSGIGPAKAFGCGLMLVRRL